MRRRFIILRSVTLALIALLAMRANSASALPHPEYREASGNVLLRFGQSLALADFDGDDRIDNATLVGDGRNKTLEIRLSSTRTRALLHFDTLTSDRGSLFASDVDNDGDNDLIWTDLIHPDAVVIWLDDGAGRFEQVPPDKYNRGFVLTDAPACGQSEDSHQLLAINPQRDPASSLSQSPRTPQFETIGSFDKDWQRGGADSCLKTSFDRGPPALF